MSGGGIKRRGNGHGPTPAEVALITLWDAGHSLDHICKTLGLNRASALSQTSRLSEEDSLSDHAFWAGIRHGSALLGKAVVAAGGHR